MATQKLPATPNSAPHAAPPCFFHRRCGNLAVTEKQGKTLCRPCADAIAADEFPLRAPSRDPLYWSADDLVHQLGMEPPRNRRRGSVHDRGE
jgi:hypothetical protein